MKSKFLHLLNDKLVKLVNLVMQSLKATKRQSDTTIFAKSLKSLKSLMSIFAESVKVSKFHDIFANYGVKDVRVSLGQYRTDYQRISNLYLTPNRFFTRFAAVFALVFVMGVGNVFCADVTGTIYFGNASGSTAVSSTSVTGNDSQENEWTITTVISENSFTQNASYSQIGASKKPATSITFTTSLPSAQTITAFSAKFGGFSGTAGTVTLKVGETTVGTGSLNATNDVIVSATNTTTSGTVLTVTVTGISKGVKAYYISYSYPKPEEKCNVTLNRNGVTETINNVVVGTDIDDIDGTSAQGGCSAWTFEGWSKTQRAAQNNSTAMTLATEVDGPGPYYAVYSHAESGGGSSSGNETITLSDGSFTTDHIDWSGTSCTITQTKGSGSSNVSSDYVSAPRVYKGHILSFVANTNYTITKIEITVNSTNYGNSMTAGTAISGTAVTNNTTDVGRTWTSTSGGTHEITSVDDDGLSAIYIQNVASVSNVQLRPTGIKVYYIVSGGSTTYYSTTANCCTSLAQINGSFKLTQNSASARAFSWTNETTVADVDHYELSYKEKTAEGDPTPIANNITNSTHAYTHEANLTEGKTYTYYLKAVGASGHCDATEEVDVLIPFATSTVTFNDNGKTSGSVPDAITQNTGTTVTVPGNTGNLAKDNYAFGGWNTKDDGTGTNYVADATFTLSNDITLYAKWDCAKKVTLTKGTPSNGSFSLSEADGDKYTCDGSVVVTVSDITPTSGYRLVGITQTGMESGVTIDQENKTVTYAQYANGSSTINVEFEQIPVHTITWMVNGAEYTTGNPTTSVVDGNGITALPTTPTSCNTTTYGTFVGWYTTAAGSDSEPSNAVSGTKAVINHVPTGNETYYAVWANGALSADEVKQVTLDFTDNSEWGFPTDYVNFTKENSYTNSYTVKLAGSGAASTGYKWNSSTSALIIGKEDAYLKLPAFSFATSKIVVTGPASGASGKVTWNTFVGDDAVSTEVTGSNANHTFNIASANQAAGNVYAFKVTNDNNLQIKTIEVYSPGAGATAFISSCCTKHTITLDDEIANGSVASTESSVCEGTSVTLTATATPNAGRFNSWNITGLDSYSATTNPLTFDMPDNDVTVSATFDALYAITKVEEGGRITLGTNYAAENDVVTISAVAKQDYEEPRVLKVYKTNDESTEITITNGQFTMPGYPVTAKVTYTPSKTPLPAPTMSANSNLTYNSVQLNWTNVANNSGYVLTVKQGEDIVEGYNAKVIDQNATSTVISGLEHLTAYTYTLYAKGDGVTYVAVNTAANGGFTTLDYPTVKIYYSENEVLRVAEGTDQQILTDFTLPSDALTGCTQKELVGWTTAENAEYSHASTAPTPLYAPGANFTIHDNQDVTLYAVYATEVPGATTQWTIESTDLEVLDSGQNSAYDKYKGDQSKSGITYNIADVMPSATQGHNGDLQIKKTSGKLYNKTAFSKDISSIIIAGADISVFEGTSEISSTPASGAISATGSGPYTYTFSSGKRYFHIQNATNGAAYPSSITVNVVGAPTYSAYATTCTGKVATPSFSGVTDSETYEENKTVSLGCATGEATIRYTMSNDGTTPADPTGESTAATSISLNADGVYVIKAKAFKDGMDASDVATISVTINKPFTTIASFIAAAPSTAKKLVFTAESNARVLAYNKNRIYIQDGTGAMFLYNAGSNNEGHGKTWASGKKIVGTLTGTYTTNNNMPRMTVTDFGTTDVTEDAIELPTPTEVDALATNFTSNVCKLVTISGVSIRSESVTDNNTINMIKNDVTYNIYNAFNALTSHILPLNSTSCTVTGILGQSNSGTTLQLMPISADAISTNGAEAVLPTLSATGSTNSAEPFEVATNKVINFTPNSNFSAVYAVNDGEETAVGNSTSVTITDEVNATKVYIKATREYYTDKEVTYYYLANPALIEYDINKSSMSHGSATIQNAQGDEITYAVGGTTITLVANPAEHYHWVSWEVTAGGEPVTVTNNTFVMPDAEVTVSATFGENDFATVAFAKGNESVTGDAPTSQKVYVGEDAIMPGKGTMILSSHNFAGWKLGDNAVLNAGDHYTVTAADHEAGTITFEAQWEPYPWALAGKWELVTSASEITVNPTTYVIFADTLTSGNTACGLTQNDNNRAAVSVTKTDNLLTWTGADPAIFIVEEGKDQGTFAFYDAINNNYIHADSDSKNYLHSNTNKNTEGAAWTISAIRPNGGATITADTYSRNLLNMNGNICAAYTSPQKGLAIYKFVGGSYYNIVYAKGTEDEVRNMPESHVTDENAQSAIKDNTPIRVGYTFSGWKDQDENVYTYNDGQIYAFTKNVTLTAQWEEQTDKYTVSYDANGSSDAVPAEAAYFENAEVTVAGAVSKEGFVFIGWECNGRVYTAGSRFYMPAADMPMVAKYAHGATYDNMTKVSNVYSIESHDAPEGSEAVFTNSYTTAKQITNGNSMTLTLSGYTGYTIEGVKLSTGSNNTSGQGTLSITIGGVEVATDANADKWYNGVHHYGSNNGTDFENVLVSMNPKTVKYGEDIVITIAASESSLFCQSFTILYDLLPVEVEDAATIEARDLANGTEVTIHDGGTLNVNANKSLDNLIIEAGGEVSGASALTVNNLTINSEAGKSGQVMNENVTVNGDIYLEIKLDKSGTMDPHKYYCISAPFDVAALEWGNGTPMVFNVDYQLFIYDGDKRARTGNGWQRVGGTIEKNSAYFIGFDDENTNNQNIIRLKAANKAIPTATSIELEEHPATYGQDESEIAKNSNWNGLGNPRLNYVNLNKNVSVYEAEEERFDTYAEELANGFVVGTAFFVQGTGNLTFENEAHGAYRAPKRESEHYMYCVEIAQENASRYDNRLYVMASETASTSFEEGKDLPTLNSETSKYGALIWTKNYGMRLVIEETPMVNNKASYELGIFAPANGTYRIETPTVREDADLYLTYEGAIIWDLSMGAYEAELAKGQNEGYGLLLVKKMPMTPTGVDEVQSDKVQCTKVVIDEHVYILRGGEMYDVTGKAVK